MLEDLLNTPQPAAAPDRRGSVVFSQEWDATGTESIVTATTGAALGDQQHLHDFILGKGGIIPDGHTAVMIASKYNPNAWYREEPYDDQGKKTPAVTRGAWSYTFRITRTNSKQNHIDELLKLVNKKPGKQVDNTTDEVYVFAMGDSQLGKVDAHGSTGIVAAWTESLTTARREWTRLGRPAVLVAGLGDHIEGNQSQNGRNFFRSDLTVSEQLRVFRRMLLSTIDNFIEAPAISVGIVNGNHDDIQRFQTTDSSDGHATESAVAVAEAISLNPARYGHVSIYVPGKDQDHLVIDFHGTNFVLIHGHQWARNKAMEWWEKQTFNNQPAAVGDILLHGHEHEFQISSRRDRLIVCVPALEEESTWYKQKAGAMGRRGVLTFTTKPKGQFARMGIV
jgi:predicted phosphodiesterase